MWSKISTPGILIAITACGCWMWFDFRWPKLETPDENPTD